jgi:hypothetical protein
MTSFSWVERVAKDGKVQGGVRSCGSGFTANGMSDSARTEWTGIPLCRRGWCLGGRVDVDGIWGYPHGKVQGSREILS